VSARGEKDQLTKPILAELTGAEVVGAPARQLLGQLQGRTAARFGQWHDGTPDRVLATWVVRAPAGTTVVLAAAHERAGRTEVTVVLGDT
jgi:hypothetical protein